MRGKMNPALALYATTFLLCICLAMFPAACSGNHRQKTLHAALVATNVARDSFVAWDAAHQKQIVEKSSTHEEGEAKLAAYRAKRDGIVAYFETVYRAIALAATQSDKQSLRDAETMGVKLLNDLEAMKEP